jgi:hypothetical protein
MRRLLQGSHIYSGDDISFYLTLRRSIFHISDRQCAPVVCGGIIYTHGPSSFLALWLRVLVEWHPPLSDMRSVGLNMKGMYHMNVYYVEFSTPTIINYPVL